MASIRDVAQRAGVGVGHCVEGFKTATGYVAEDTRKKIEMAISELEYTPNELARNLFRNKNRDHRRAGARSGSSVFLGVCPGDGDRAL